MFSDGHLGIHLPPVFVPMLSFIVFWSAITLGQAIQYTRIIKTQVIADKYEGKSFQPGSWRTLLCAVSIIVAESWWTMDIWNMDSIVASYITIPAALENSQWFAMIPIKVSTVRIIIVVLGSIMIFAPAIILLILFARNRSQAAMAILCMGYCTFITQLYQIPLIRTRGPIGAVRWT